ncbi:MAG: HIT family protein [Candidatus Magasanikbacteria bacterium]
MQECDFCKIVDGEIPNHTVYEDNHSLAFLDINPQAKGHTIVIPKVHAETYFDLNEELVKELFKAVQRAMENIDSKINPDGYNVGWNQGKAGGQVVPHLHVHIMPRWEDDGGGNMHSIVDSPGDMKVEEVAELFN